jgi:hypothetical protein
MELSLLRVTPDASGKEYICNQKSKKMIKAICLPTNVDEKPNFSICFTTILNYVTHDYVTYEYVTYE